MLTLVVSGSAEPWSAAGFHLAGDADSNGGYISLGELHIDLLSTPDPANRDDSPVGVRCDHVVNDDVNDDVISGIDGIPTFGTRDRSIGSARTHPNGVDGLDHLVVATPNHGRTRSRLGEAGLEHRRTTADPRGGAMAQSFFWAGSALVELVGPFDEDGSGPASVWGLSLVAPDLDLSAAWFEDRCSRPKDAIQPGRRIATLDTLALDLPLRISMMSPRPGAL